MNGTRCKPGEHSWMGNPDIIMSDEPIEKIAPFACRACDATGITCPRCLGKGDDGSTCPACGGWGIVPLSLEATP